MALLWCRKSALFFILLFSGAFVASAQFVSLGDDPGTQKWMQISTKHYNVIYPMGRDSLAFRYGRTLEKYYYPVSYSTGFVPDSAFTRKVPVILHSFTEESNGMVTFAPHRMDLFTTPDIHDPMSVPWEEHLVSHESRHLSQMQFAFMHGWKALRYIFGEIGPTVPYLLYTDSAILEGDAVVIETALSPSGRGRSADFLEYYNTSLAQGDYRSWWQWRYGSLRKHTPSYYVLGYVTAAGLRSIWDEAYFPKRMTDRLYAKGLPFVNFPKTVRDISGKSFKKTFEEICDSLVAEKAALDARRGPFLKAEQLTSDERSYTAWLNNTVTGDYNYVIRSGKTRTAELMRVDSLGHAEKLHDFPDTYHTLCPGDEAAPLWWTEPMEDPRWKLKSYSVIKYIDSRNRIHEFSRTGKFYYPAVDEHFVTAIEQDNYGNSFLTKMLRFNGTVILRRKAPQGVQFTELAEGKGLYYVIGVSSKGTGIYRLVGNDLQTVLEPTYSKITNPAFYGDELYFESDRSGVMEWYRMNPESGKVYQLSCTEFGGTDWCFNSDGSYATFIGSSSGGRNLYKVSSDQLICREVDFAERYVPRFAVDITRQESELASACKAEPADTAIVKGPSRYRKFPHLFRLHSWAPFYVDYNAISDKSMENLFTSVRLGASAFFQNNLGTFTGIAGLRVASDDGWIPSFSGQFTYSGFYPVIEGSFKFGRDCSGTLKTYIPWSWSSDGWNRGLIPQLSYSVSSSSFTIENRTYFNSTLATGLRGYVMKNVAPSAIYPRFGAGAELGLASYPSIDVLNTNYFAFMYVYLPGVMRTHGMKLSALVQSHFGDKKYCTPYATVTPRGFASSRLNLLLSTYPVQSKFTFDYAFPFGPIDWDGLCPVAYIRNFEASLHGDLSYFYASEGHDGNLASVGADLSLVLGNILWLQFPTRIGISYNYNFGASYDALNNQLTKEKAAPLERNRVSLVFSVDF